MERAVAWRRLTVLQGLALANGFNGLPIEFERRQYVQVWQDGPCKFAHVWQLPDQMILFDLS